jgi:drug/metabolite transporter (DMT)-like permease
MLRLSILIPLLLTVCGSVVYHLAVKSVPQSFNPALALVGAYATALCASIAAYLFLPVPQAPGHAAQPWHPSVFAIGVAVAMIGLGYLLTYRAAWPVSTASALANSLVAALLVPIGITMFGEQLTAMRGVGIALCMTGVVLLTR